MSQKFYVIRTTVVVAVVAWALYLMLAADTVGKALGEAMTR